MARSDTATPREKPDPAESRFMATYFYRLARYEWGHRTTFGRFLMIPDVFFVVFAFTVILPMEIVLFEIVSPVLDAVFPRFRALADKLPEKYNDDPEK